MLNKIVISLNIFFAISLLLSYLSVYISPVEFYPLALFGLVYPVLLILNILFLLYWLVAWKKQAFISIAVIVTGWNHPGKFIEINFRNPEKNNENSIKIMSYNVRVFDLYNWTGNTKTRNKIFNLVKDESADVICFQEFFYSAKKGYFNTLDTLLLLQEAKNFHTEYTTVINDTHFFGIATFSKFPIISRGKVPLAAVGNNLCIYSDLKINNDTIRVYNAHLASLHFARSDYKFLEEITQVETGEQLKGIRQIIKRIKLALIKRSAQADVISSHISSSPYRVVFCGDFNDTPVSYAYNTISDNLKDAFMESGNGFGATYAGSKFSPFRIDYILHSPSLHSFGFETIPEELSDHYPVACRLEIN